MSGINLTGTYQTPSNFILTSRKEIKSRLISQPRHQLCLSRLSVVGLLGPDTPGPVVEEIALAHGIQVESSKLKSNGYFLQMIQKIHKTPIQNVSEPFSYRDYVLISKFINPYMDPRVWPELRPNHLPIYAYQNSTIGTLQSSLARYFGFRSWDGFESLDANFQLGLISPTSPNNVDVCILYRYCSLRGLTTNRSTTIREMEALVRMDLQGDLFFLQRQIISAVSSQNLSRRSLINALHSLVGSSIPYLAGELAPREKSNFPLRIERRSNFGRSAEIDPPRMARKASLLGRSAEIDPPRMARKASLLGKSSRNNSAPMPVSYRGGNPNRRSGDFRNNPTRINHRNPEYQPARRTAQKRPSKNSINYLSTLMSPGNLILAVSDGSEWDSGFPIPSRLPPKNKHHIGKLLQPRTNLQPIKRRGLRNITSSKNQSRCSVVNVEYHRPQYSYNTTKNSSKSVNHPNPVITRKTARRPRYKGLSRKRIPDRRIHRYQSSINVTSSNSSDGNKIQLVKCSQNSGQGLINLKDKVQRDQGGVRTVKSSSRQTICPPKLTSDSILGHNAKINLPEGFLSTLPSKKTEVDNRPQTSQKESSRSKDVLLVPLFDLVETDNIPRDSPETRLEQIHQIVNSIRSQRIIPESEPEINRAIHQKLKQLRPNSQINAVILAAVLYQIDISSCLNPILELKSLSRYGGNIEKYRPIDAGLRKRIHPNRVGIDGPVLNLVFNPLLPRPLYQSQTLNYMALSYGYTDDNITVDDPYYLLQMSVLMDHFYQGKPKTPLNQRTPIELDPIDDLNPWEYISYGHSEKGYQIIKYSELDGLFRTSGYFRYPKANSGDPDVYSRQSIKRLIILLLRPSYQNEPGKSINLRHNLALKMHQIIQDDETLLPAEINLRDKYRENDENKKVIRQLMEKFLNITMKMRGWTGVGKGGISSPYPIIHTPVDNPYQIEIRVTDAIGNFDRFCGEHEECSEIFLKYPLFKYREGYVRSNAMDDGFTIQDRLNIVKFDESITACIRLTSNWFGGTYSKMSKVLGIDQVFNIKQLRNIG